MKGASRVPIVTGMGVVTPIGIGIDSFTSCLLAGKENFRMLEKHYGGRVYKYPMGCVEEFELGGLIDRLDLPGDLASKARRIRNLSLSSSFGVFAALEAWGRSGIADAGVDLSKVAIISAGSNTQQASLFNTYEKNSLSLGFLDHHYGFSFFDSDLVGILSQLLCIQGEGFSMGAASASGAMAVIQGSRLILSGEYDIVVVVAPLMDLSIFEYQGLTSMGAMASYSGKTELGKLCRPFDASHEGFVYGQNAGCLILESESHINKRKQQGEAAIAGFGVSLDANRNPNPSVHGEIQAMKRALQYADIDAGHIDYVSAHGTSSVLGDSVEVEALLEVGLNRAWINSTKSQIGHGLSAAGLVEIIAAVVQMNSGTLHGNTTLDKPISDQLNWVGSHAQDAIVNYAMSNSFGFGGINTSIVIKRYSN